MNNHPPESDRPIVSLLVAVGHDRVMGIDGHLPWHLPAELAYFKRTTMGKPIVMGRRTYESIGRPLPGRQNIVLSRQADFEAPGCTVVHSLAGAWGAAGAVAEIVVIGGADLFEQVIDEADRLYLTLVDGDFQGDTYFPELDWNDWVETSREERAADERNPYAYTILTLDRQRPVGQETPPGGREA